MPRNPDDSPRLYYDEYLEKWLIEEYDGTIREPTPEEMDAEIARWEREAEAGNREARYWNDQ